MNSFPRWLTWVVFLALAGALGFYLYPRDATRVKRLLQELATATSFESGPPPAMALAQLQEVLKPRLGEPITLDVAELGEATWSHERLVQGFAQYAQGFSACTIRLHNVQVEFNASGTQAVAKGELSVQQIETSGIHRTEPRRFSTTLAKRDGDWFVLHAKVTESRIDQPEARP